MALNDDPLKLFAYSGRENGLMIVGSPEAIRNLGQQLQDSLLFQPAIPDQERPAKLISPVILSPYKDIPDYQLSFHVEGSKPSEQILPLTRKALSLTIVLPILIFAVIGAVTCVRWIW